MRPSAKSQENLHASTRSLSYPNSDVICGGLDCENPAHIWLTEDEENQYNAGQRVFEIPIHTRAVKVD